MAATALPNFPPFDADPTAGDIVVRWDKWVRRFRNLLTAINVTDDERHKALLLHYAGEQVCDIFDTLTMDAPGEGETVTDKAIAALTAHFAPKRNAEYEIYKFHQIK